MSETFTAVYSFERTPSAASLVERISAEHKAGLAYGGEHNGLFALGKAAQHFFKMNTWNHFRTNINDKTWTELYFEVAGLDYQAEPYVLQVPTPATARISSLLGSERSTRVCLNVGGSLQTKIWPLQHWIELGSALLDGGVELVITGDQADAPLCAQLCKALANLHGPEAPVIYEPLSIEEFSAVPGSLDVVVTGDTFGFHLALAPKLLAS